jgi:catalase
MTLNKNPDNFFAQIEQAAFEPSAVVPGIGFSPDKMLLGRVFAYADTHRYRIGPNYLQLPVNRPRNAVNSYTFDGPMAYDHSGDLPVYAPNTAARPFSDLTGPVEDSWEAGGEFHLLGGVKGDVLEKAFQYWRNVDAETGKQIEELVRQGLGEPNPGTETGRAKVEADLL